MTQKKMHQPPYLALTKKYERIALQSVAHNKRLLKALNGKYLFENVAQNLAECFLWPMIITLNVVLFICRSDIMRVSPYMILFAPNRLRRLNANENTLVS